MNKIKGNRRLIDRERPEKITKYKIMEQGAAHLTKVQKKKEYDCYICDYCGEEIKIINKWEDKTGGIITLPKSLTGMFRYKLALCNKCVKLAIKEFEEGGK